MDKTAHILLIEDEVITAMSLIMELKKHGYRKSKFVSTAGKAFASAKDSMPDLIIADVSLSGGESGIDVAAEIAGITGIPVIITSGYEQDELEDRMNILENVYFIRKPVTIFSLLQLIESL